MTQTLKEKWENELAWIDKQWGIFCSKKLTMSSETGLRIKLEEHYRMEYGKIDLFKKPLSIFIDLNMFYDFAAYQQLCKKLQEDQASVNAYKKELEEAEKNTDPKLKQWPFDARSLAEHLKENEQSYMSLCFKALGKKVDDIKAAFEQVFGPFAYVDVQYKYYELSGAKGYQMDLGIKFPINFRKQKWQTLSQMPLGFFNKLLRALMHWVLKYVGESEKVQSSEWNNVLEEMVFTPLLDQLNAGVNQYVWSFVQQLQEGMALSIDPKCTHWYVWWIKKEMGLPFNQNQISI